MSPAVASIPVVVLYPHSRCNCHCLMCDIWKETGRREFGPQELQRFVEEFQKLSVEWVVLSGGEPLMHSNLFPFCAGLKERGIRTTILSTGLLLERYAAEIVENTNDVIVSLDGPPAVHDRIRRVPGAFRTLARGVETIHRIQPEYSVSGRSTVQRTNFRHLRETARTAREIGLRSISFLAADVSSTAFNRPDGWGSEKQAEIALRADELAELEAAIDALVEEWDGDAFLVESAEKLRRVALHYRAHLGLAAPEAPRCNAPWNSAVIEADGAVRPCFFHEPIGHVRDGLLSALNSQAALAFRASLDVRTNPICRRCVCSLNWKA